MATKMSNTSTVTTSFEVLSLDNPAMRSYLFYCSLLIIKVLFIPAIIAKHRLTNSILISEEDAAFVRRWFKRDACVKTDNSDIERARRAHLNDLENIPLFLIISLAYLFTKPEPRVAAILLLIYTIARFMHTIVYAMCVIPQPARAIAYFLGLGIHLYLSLVVAIHFGSYAFI